MNVVKNKYLFIGLSTILLVLAVTSMVLFGFKQGIDFVGGALWQLKFQSAPDSLDSLNEFFSGQNLDAKIRQGITAQDFSVRMKEITEVQHQELSQSLKSEFGEFEELSFSSIGPAIGAELRNKAFFAFLLVIIGISLYIAFAFRKVSYPVSSWKYGLITLITLFHDAIIPAGLFAFWGRQYGLEVDTNFIVAILVIMGFSVHDTIVVFDRIRENLLHAKRKDDFSEIVNVSVNQTFARSLNTSMTLFIVLIALYLFGAHSLSYFNLLILVGTIIGTYSSIFVASPLLTLFNPGK